MAEQRNKLAKSIKRSGELAKLMEDENANVRKARQELESMTFRDPDSQVGNFSNKEYKRWPRPWATQCGWSLGLCWSQPWWAGVGV